MDLRLKSVVLIAGLAAVFGFLGATGAVLVFHGTLRGESGAKGPAGPAGPVGPAGLAAPADGAVRTAVAGLEEDMVKLDAKVSALQLGSDGCGLITQVVTDVASGFDGSVRTSKSPVVCLTMP
jgi:hypothetical protein